MPIDRDPISVGDADTEVSVDWENEFKNAINNLLEFAVDTDDGKINASQLEIDADAETAGDRSLILRLTATLTRVLKWLNASGWFRLTDQDGTTLYPLELADGTEDTHAATVGQLAATELDDLADVTITDPADRQGLIYNGSGWVNGAVGSMTLLDSKTASNSASIDFTDHIDDTYDLYILLGVGIVPANNAVAAWLRVSEDAGSSWKADAADYKYSGFVYGIAAGSGGSPGTAGQIELTHGATLSNNAANAFNFFATVSKPADTTIKKEINLLPHGYVTSGGDYYTMMRTGAYVGTTNAIDGLRVMMSDGAIAAGSFYLYGVKRP
jgi:hypothetical protein